nr:MAG TPA: hypothetical protein [Caudoviricetes sp.]
MQKRICGDLEVCYLCNRKHFFCVFIALMCTGL